MAIQVTALSKSFDGDVALADLSLDINRGDLVCILGRNGAGKSTLLKCVAGLIGFDSGTIQLGFLDGDEVLKDRSGGWPINVRKRIGVVFQEPSLWPHMKVKSNVAHPLQYTRDLAFRDAEERAEYWLERLGVAKQQWDMYPSSLSGGVRRRVAIARTFATAPEILLLDEVEVHLDPEAMERVLALIEELYIPDSSRTVVMITHRVDFLTRAASRVAVIDSGQLIEYDTPEKILEHPEPRTEEFIREVIDPARSDWKFTTECLESAVKISAAGLTGVSQEVANLQPVVDEVNSLLERVERGSPHLILAVTKSQDRLLIRGAHKSDEFVLDGKDAGRLGRLVRQTGDDKASGTFRLAKGHCERLAEGVELESSRSLIKAMVDGELQPRYAYSKNWSTIPIYHTDVPPRHDSATMFYYEFSKQTRQVYLVPMMSGTTVRGVLSVDTGSETKWRPFLARGLLLLANLAALVTENATGFMSDDRR